MNDLNLYFIYGHRISIYIGVYVYCTTVVCCH